MAQLIQLAGSMLIITAYIALQRGRMSSDSTVYLVLNVIGSSVLAVLAAVEEQWGFLLLEMTWAVVSAASLGALVRRNLSASS